MLNNSIAGIFTIAHRYDAFILDLWGVIHDGTHLYPGVHDTLVELRRAGKKILFLSNAPRRTHKVEVVLNGLGIEALLYDGIISSGEVGYQWLKQNPKQWRRYFYIGPLKDEDVANGLHIVRVDTLEQADFLLNVGYGSEEEDTQDWTPLFKKAQSLAIPMVCLNPDLEVVRQTGEVSACAGALAHAYEDMGGNVLWFGKPYEAVYEACLNVFAAAGSLLDKSKILAVGDSIRTDIQGAASFGVDSLLVTGGIHKRDSAETLERLYQSYGATPTYTISGFSW